MPNVQQNKELLLQSIDGANQTFFNQPYSLNKFYEVINLCIHEGDNEALTKILKNCNQKILNPDNPISFSELISKHFDSSFIFKGNEEILKTLCNFAYEHNITAIWGIKNLGVCILKPASLISTELAAIENSDNPNDLEIIGDHNSAN